MSCLCSFPFLLFGCKFMFCSLQCV
uniref:Uncharacterized protein n=1 Tax=Rhizophora mucronata TaxID=61149 RepID=A0A2P2P7N7_RHIMU